MTKVTAYQASDGKLFDVEGDCRDYEDEVLVRKALAKFTRAVFFAEMSPADFTRVLFDNRGSLRRILS